MGDPSGVCDPHGRGAREGIRRRLDWARDRGEIITEIADGAIIEERGQKHYSPVGKLGDNFVDNFAEARFKGGMKRDGRTLDHATLETIRLMAVERVLEGEVASAVITSYGRPAPGRPRRLTPGQEQQVFRWINGKD